LESVSGTGEDAGGDVGPGSLAGGVTTAGSSTTTGAVLVDSSSASVIFVLWVADLDPAAVVGASASEPVALVLDLDAWASVALLLGLDTSESVGLLLGFDETDDSDDGVEDGFLSSLALDDWGPALASLAEDEPSSGAAWATPCPVAIAAPRPRATAPAPNHCA